MPYFLRSLYVAAAIAVGCAGADEHATGDCDFPIDVGPYITLGRQERLGFALTGPYDLPAPVGSGVMTGAQTSVLVFGLPVTHSGVQILSDNASVLEIGAADDTALLAGCVGVSAPVMALAPGEAMISVELLEGETLDSVTWRVRDATRLAVAAGDFDPVLFDELVLNVGNAIVVRPVGVDADGALLAAGDGAALDVADPMIAAEWRPSPGSGWLIRAFTAGTTRATVSLGALTTEFLIVVDP